MTEPMHSPALAYISLGANLGDPTAALASALEAIAKDPKITLLKASSFYRTSPVESSGPDYVNAAALIETTYSPEALLECLLSIENENGRRRPAGIRNAPRTLDLDLLAYGSEKRSTPKLTLPHPRMTERLFVLVPLAEIAPDWRDERGRSAASLIAEVSASDPSQQIAKLAS